ncbi:MAG: hypothetical protein U9Q84_05690 [Thermodesulfobacteriota bacterium]|nr:hypothetical protein [Thermodesulfobacteriota bacterium]
MMASHRKERLLKVMTYNIHSCIGVDRKISPERIAKIIARYEPDIFRPPASYYKYPSIWIWLSIPGAITRD